MKIFITGGTGFIGGHVIERLVTDGHDVMALARSSTASSAVTQMGATPVIGDLQSIDSWKGRLDGCDAVVHCAAPVDFWGDWDRYEADIAIATSRLLEAASNANVSKFIHLSSESVLQDVSAIENINESYFSSKKPNSNYGAAKKLAELELIQSESPMNVIILRPSFVWGERSKSISELIERAKSGKFIWASGGKLSFEAVHVLNLTHAIGLALHRGVGKQIYFVTDDEAATVREFFSRVFDAFGARIPKISLPSAFIQHLASVTETIWLLFKIKSKPPLTRFEWAFIGMPRKYDISKIKNHLGYTPIISRAEGFRRLAVEHGG